MTAGLIWKALIGSFWLRVAAAALAGVGAIKGYGMYQRHVGATRAVAQINEKAEKQSVQAIEARKHADRPGAAGRLLKQHCRDC